MVRISLKLIFSNLDGLLLCTCPLNIILDILISGYCSVYSVYSHFRSLLKVDLYSSALYRLRQVSIWLMGSSIWTKTRCSDAWINSIKFYSLSKFHTIILEEVLLGFINSKINKISFYFFFNTIEWLFPVQISHQL